VGYRMIKLPSDEPVQYVGVYVRQWGDVVLGEVTRPQVGFIEDELMLSDEAVKVIDDWMDSHGFETRYLALQDLLLEFERICIEDERDHKQEVYAQIEHENRDSEED